MQFLRGIMSLQEQSNYLSNFSEEILEASIVLVQTSILAILSDIVFNEEEK